MKVVDILIPTYNNHDQLVDCLRSLLNSLGSSDFANIIVINNGDKDSCNWIKSEEITVVQDGDNLGWEGGLLKGLEVATAPYVLFLNDDTFFPISSIGWIQKLLQNFRYPGVVAVGPSSNVVMGPQNIFVPSLSGRFSVPYLIGFCLLIERTALDAAGGVDASLPGGDDLDISIRLRDNGGLLVVDKGVFVYHHGFQTGTRVYGGSQKSGGWNSTLHTEKTNHALIRKHGFKKWSELFITPHYQMTEAKYEDKEGEIVRQYVKPGIVLDVGCGGRKTVEPSIGLDMLAGGSMIPTINMVSVADIVHDVSKPLPFQQKYADTIIARHILEHLIDPIYVLDDWSAVLKRGGRLILALPDDQKFPTIVTNPEHVHAYTRDSAKSLLEAFGFKIIANEDSLNGISFVIVGEKQ